MLTTHLGLSDIGQCEATNELRNLVESGPSDVILLGDLNTYFDFEWPMDTLTRPDDSFTVSSFNPCGEVNRRFSFLRSQEVLKTGQTSYEGFSVDQPVSLKRKNVATMVDVYSRVTNDAPRRPLSSTFTNFRDFRVQDNSRPDRILVGKDSILRPCNLETFGADSFTHDGQQAYPSDHRGVMATFACRDRT